MSFYRKILYQNGKPIQGVQARLYLGNKKVRNDTTDYYGEYRFDDLENGNYQVRFFGEDFTEDDYIEFSIAGETPPIDFVDTPNLAVSETGYDFEAQGEISKGQFNLTSLTTNSGNIRTISIELKLTSEAVWQLASNFDFGTGLDGVADNLASAIFSAPVKLLDKPSNYDFRATFFNGDKIPAKTNTGNVIYASDLNIIFNGIPDLAEYAGVEELEVRNTNAAGDTLPTNEIILTWDDPRKIGEADFINAAGNEIHLTNDQLENITGYVVYMFISDGGLEPSDRQNYPAKTETNGAWYLLDTVPEDTPAANIRLPQKKQIMLWVGFQTSGVVTAAPEEYYSF